MAGPRPPPTSRRPLTAIRGPESPTGASAHRLTSATAAVATTVSIRDRAGIARVFALGSCVFTLVGRVVGGE